MPFLKKIVVSILIWESRLILAKYRPFIVAVTGSVGKTSTKDAIYSVLKDHGRYVRKAEKSMNSEVGLPITVIGVPNAWRSIGGWLSNIAEGLRLILSRSEYPDCLILEFGADHPGDISRVAAWLKPDIAVITQVSETPVHVEFFDSPEAVFEEKASLAEAVKAAGTLILFADNEKVLSLAGRVKPRGVQVITFGTTEKATVRGSEQKVVYEYPKTPSGFTFKLDMEGTSEQISIQGILGEAYLYPLLAAAAVAKARSIPLPAIVRGLSTYEAPLGRMNIIPGLNTSTIIDDTYNSSPDAAVSALRAIKSLESTGAKIALLGDMMELGSYSGEEHRKIGREAATGLSRLITVGPRSRATAAEAVSAGFSSDMVRSFDTSIEAGEYVKSLIVPGDVILVKGSQSIRMERAVKLLMHEPDKAAELLVRQEPEWLERL